MELKNNFSKALTDIKNRGWGFINSYYSQEKCDLIKKTLDYPSFPVNLNQPYPSFQEGTKFNNNVLTLSKEAFEVVTNKQLIQLTSDFVSGEVILKCIRTYSIAKKYPLFEWHADNVNPVTFEADESIGINCILYLEDDEEGTFSVAENVFHDMKNEFCLPPKEEIDSWKSANKIKKIFAKKGDLVLFNQSIYHRHITKTKKSLDALWFQISDVRNSTNERILLDASFIPEDIEILKFLGSGKGNIGFSNPNTKIHNLTPSQLTKIGLMCLFLVPFSLFVNLGKKFDKFLLFSLGINLTSTRKFFKNQVKSLIKN